LVPFIALTEAGAPFETINVNMGKGQHMSPDYLRLNPKHKVPVLLIDGEALTENVAIQLWIARHFPNAGLMPESPALEIKVISFLAWCASGIHPALTPNALPQQYCDLPGSEANVRFCAQKKLLEHFRIAEDLLIGKDWFFGTFSTADIYFYWCFRRALQFGVDLSAFTRCMGHHERMNLRASTQKVIAYEATVLAEFAAAH
jgi:glutathione S-transferase